MNERRRSPRFGFRLPVKVRSPHPTGCSSGDGSTRDISARGAYFVVPGDGISVAAKLDLEITLTGEITGDEEVLIRVSGRVVRVDELVENGREQVGVAVTI